MRGTAAATTPLRRAIALTEEPEIVVPFPVPRDEVPMARAYAASGIATSISILRERGHYDAYLRHLPAEHHEEILSLVAGRWIPIELAAMHYRACDALRLPVEEILAIGEQAAARLYSPLVVVSAKLAAGAGFTPWSVVRKISEGWTRTMQGSAISVVKLGPKDGRLEIEGYPLMAIPYVRIGLVGVLRQPIDLLCRKAFVREVRMPGREASGAYHISWV